MRSILDLSSDDARRFFLNQRSYCNISLPVYFNFQPILDAVADDYLAALTTSNLSKYSSCLKGFCKKKADEVNYQIYANKDGEFAWRRLQLLNPIAYVFLVFQITEERNWNTLVRRFKEFQKNEKIKCCSIPISKMETNSVALNVSNWWHENEQESIKLSMKYSYMMTTDISDCYGSIYTHSIPWAIHGQEYAKRNQNNKQLIGNQIDDIIQSISYNQTNGLPQGSVLMDFIAEIVLGYIDSLLSDALKYEKIRDYYILRYRDDYRIFTNEKENAIKIAKALASILADLSLTLNANKTSISENIIYDSVKLDKLSWMEKEKPITFQKRLLEIHKFSNDFPNSGTVEKGLCEIADDIRDNVTQLFTEDLDVIFSILVDIAFRNPRTYSIVIVILGQFLPILNKAQAKQLFDQIEEKFRRVSNTEFMSIWMQRLTIKINPRRKYNSKICTYVQQINKSGRSSETIWEHNGFTKIFKDNPILDISQIEQMPQIPNVNEVELFWHY